MLNTIDTIAEKILTNGIDKQEAIRSFERLSEPEKNLLISKLKFKLSGSDNAVTDSVETNALKKEQAVLLKTVDERSLNEQHEKYISQLAKDLGNFAPKSKENALKHQQYFVDQRKISNLKKCLKSVQFHLTYEKAEGSYLFDIDGNQYVDITGDNGVNIFGHQPEFIKEAIIARVNKGFPLVGYTDELFKAAKLFTDLTGHERVLFTQSGTEALMWAVRIARAATGKKKIVIFEGSYHGLSDAVIAMKDQFGNSLALGRGMLQEFADQLIVLDYGDMDQLDIIEKNADEIAGVLVEPVQSRHPDLQPVEFLKEIRKLTLEKDIPLIFDEMITGFRVCPKGTQGYFNIKADIATYGKIPGGGMPTGMIAGLAKYMNYVDGGTWNFDDDSMPSLKRTLMAGTHTRNPVKIAASLAVLSEINARCSGKLECATCTCFQKELNQKTKSMVDELNVYFLNNNFPIIIESFSSLFRFRFLDSPNGLTSELLFILMRMNGVETSVSGNFFLTTAHTDENIKSIVSAVKKSVETLLAEGFFYVPELVTVEAEEEVEYLREPVHALINTIETQHAENNSSYHIELIKNLLKSDLQKFLGEH
ncbi:MAG: aminotransferase class III-fold pyridoxal phosphate-dependent enzyme [Pseudomonadota bacterium]